MLKIEVFMQIKPGFVKRKVAGRYVAVATGEASKNFNGMIKLNGTASAIWDGLQQGLPQDQIAQQLVAEYAVELPQAQADVAEFCQQLVQAGIAEE